MSFPPVDALFRRVRALIALDARSTVDGIHTFFEGAMDGAEVLICDDGAGNHCLLIRSGDRALLKAFDHESAASPYTNDDELPDPALTEGLPVELAGWLSEAIGPYLPHERTFCAWDNGSGWTCRGADPSPADRFLDDELVVDWLADRQLQVDPDDLAAVLAGEAEAEELAWTRIVPPTVRGPAGWTRGDAFSLAISARQPVSSIEVLKLVRSLTGGSLGEIKRALAECTPLYEPTLQTHSIGQVGALESLGQILRALEPLGGSRLVATAGGDAIELDEEGLRAMLGSEAYFLS